MNLRKNKELLDKINQIQEKVSNLNVLAPSVDDMNPGETEEYMLEIGRCIRELREYRKQLMVTSICYDRM